MKNNELTRVSFIEEEDGGSKVDIVGYPSDTQTAIYTLIECAAEMTHKTRKQYIAELLVVAVMMDNKHCDSCDEYDCEANGCNSPGELADMDLSNVELDDLLRSDFDLNDFPSGHETIDGYDIGIDWGDDDE